MSKGATREKVRISKPDRSGMRLGILMWLAIALLAFVAGMATGIRLSRLSEPVAATPLVVDFCSLAKNQEFFTGTRVVTTAKLVGTIHGAVLDSDCQPELALPFEGPSNDACWEKISADYYANMFTTDYLVTLEAFVRGPRRTVNWFHKSDKPMRDTAHRAPLVTLVVKRIANCARE